MQKWSSFWKPFIFSSSAEENTETKGCSTPLPKVTEPQIGLAERQHNIPFLCHRLLVVNTSSLTRGRKWKVILKLREIQTSVNIQEKEYPAACIRAHTAGKFLEREATSSCPPKVLMIVKKSLSTCF